MQVLSSPQKRDVTPSQLSGSGSYEFIFAVSGTASVKTQGTEFILSGRQMLILYAPCERTLSVKEAPFSYYFFTISADEVTNTLGASRLSGLFLRRFKSDYHIFDFSGSPDAIEIAERLEKESAIDGNASLRAVLFRLLTLEMYKANPSPFGNNLRENKRIREIREYIDTHFGENITVEQLAKSSYVTAPYLSHSFKSFSGFSPKQYLTLVRLMNAKKLLYTTDLSINEICRETGFSDINNFIRTFKSFYGTTPKKLRSM